MSSTDVGTATSTEMAELWAIDMGLEVVTLPVSDVDRATRRDDLVRRGVDVSEMYERPSFRDPDGNGWPLQEITARLPGREWED
jgi:hypothetical protein